MEGFKLNTCINVHDLDYNGIAKASSILKYMQTAAEAQLSERGMSYNELRGMGRAFILSKIRLELTKPFRDAEPITAITFPSESRGFSFLRCYGIEQEGVTVARAVSLWALIDTNDRSLVKVNDFNLDLPLLPPLDLTFNRFRMPDGLVDVGGYGVHYGDVDRNMHMNNTKYPNMYSNYLPLVGKRISSISINYLSEAKMGEKMRVLRAGADDRFYFRTVKSDGTINSEAEITLCDI